MTKKLKNFAAIALSILLCLITLAGCSDFGEVENRIMTASNDRQINMITDDVSDYEYWGGDGESLRTLRTLTDLSSDLNTTGTSSSDNNTSHDRKVIRNVYMTVETAIDQDLSAVYNQLVAFCNSLGGYEFSANINNYAEFSSVNAVLKVPPEKLDEFTSYVGEHTTIRHSNVESDDVTAEFYDLTTRLETKRRSLNSYYTLLESAEGLDEIIQIQRTIDNITEEIEAVEGRLRVLSSLVDMATVSMAIFQEDDPAANRREVDWGALSAGEMGFFIRSGFVSVMNIIVGIVQWGVIILLVLSPLWIPATILIVILVKRNKKKTALRAKQKQEQQKQESQEPKQEKSEETTEI
jgi:hypothetical protein